MWLSGDSDPFCNMDSRIQSFLEPITNSLGLLILPKVLRGTEFARSFQIASLFHGLPPWPWRPQDPKVALPPQSQTRFFKIESLFILCKCIHVGVTSIFLCEGLFFKEKINLMMCFKERVES